MNGLEHQTYWEIIIHPSHFLEQFTDFIIEKTSCAIEHLDISPTLNLSASNPFAISYDEDSWQSFNDFSISQAKALSQNNSDNAQPTQIIIRLVDDFDISSLLQSLQNYALDLSAIFEKSVSFCYHIEKKANCDWIKAYQDSIQPISSGIFYIRPSWYESQYEDEDSKSPQTKHEIIINPALAFGSGHHASTAMCLEFLSQLDLHNKTLLDVGCGSGILSIAAHKLGAKVYACDTDESAVLETHKNAKLNNATLCDVWQGSIAQAPQDSPATYDVITANIIAFVVKLLHNDFKAKLAKNGVLILSGILDEYKFDIMQTFSDFKVLESRCQDEWVALKLTLE